MISVEHNNQTIMAASAAEIIARGVPEATAGAGLKSHAMAELVAYANTVRAKLASGSAGKLAEYRVKEEIAANPGSAHVDELALIDREAVARGTDQAGLLAIIAAKAAAFRKLALEVGAIEAEGKAAINAVSDLSATLDADVQAAMVASKGHLKTTLINAQALLAGL